MQNFIQKGDTLTFTVNKAVASGQLVIIGSLPCVACAPYAANQPGEYRTEGVYDFPAAAKDTAKAGDPAFFDGTNIAAAGASAVGVFALDKPAGALTARVRLDGVALARAAA